MVVQAFFRLGCISVVLLFALVVVVLTLLDGVL